MKTTTLPLQNKCGIVGNYKPLVYYNTTGTGTVDKLKALYDKSGSKKTFAEWLIDLKRSQNKSETPVLDWLQSDSAKEALLKAQKLIDSVQGKVDGTDPSKIDNSVNPNPTKVTIAGFHPVTFAVGSIFLLVGAYFGGRFLINKYSK